MFYTTKTNGSASIEKDITPFHADANIQEKDQWQVIFSEDEDEIMDLMVDSMISTVHSFIFSNRLTRSYISDNIGSVTGFKDASCADINVQVKYLFP